MSIYTKKRSQLSAIALRASALAILVLPLSLGACEGDIEDEGMMVEEGADAGPVDSVLCTSYCSAVTTNCTDDNARYADMSDCLSYCAEAQWPDGEKGNPGGNTLECRIYHSGVPAAAEPNEHCAHAGADGGGVCGAELPFRADLPDVYTRVDRIGMPAVSTALVSSGMKSSYNDSDPSDDAEGTFVAELAANLTAIHGALDDDLEGLGLTPCSMDTIVNGLPECFGQELAAGVSVASLVLPDTLHIDPNKAAGFPNGRRLVDPVIDVTLGVILLKLGASCGGASCSPVTLVDPPLNPPANDVEFDSAFPYLAAPHTP